MLTSKESSTAIGTMKAAAIKASFWETFRPLKSPPRPDSRDGLLEPLALLRFPARGTVMLVLRDMDGSLFMWGVPPVEVCVEPVLDFVLVILYW